MKTLYLIRHGQTDSNRLGLIQGQLDTPRLTDVGRKQLERAAKYLLDRQTLANPVIWSGTLTRSIESAKILQRILSTSRVSIQDARLNQRSWGSVQGMTMAELSKRLNSEQAFLGESAHNLAADAEPIASVMDRIDSFLGDLRHHDGEQHIIVSHDEFINYFWNRIQRMEPFRHHIDNGEIIKICWKDDAMANAERIFPSRLVCTWYDITYPLSIEGIKPLTAMSAQSVSIRDVSEEDYSDVRAIIIGDRSFGLKEAERFPSLELVVRYGSGYENVQVADLATRKIRVMRLLRGSEQSVAEFTVASAIMALRVASQAIYGLRQTPHIWRAANRQGIELAGSRVGIIGYGRIGRASAALFRKMGANVLAWNRTWRKEQYDHSDSLGIKRIPTIGALMTESDVICIHLALTDQTRGLISRELFDSLRRSESSVALVNVARGGIVDEAALLDALEIGYVSSAVIDVWSSEGQTSSIIVDKLRQHPHVIPTPHMAAFTTNVKTRLHFALGTSIAAYLERRFSDIVDAELIVP